MNTLSELVYKIEEQIESVASVSELGGILESYNGSDWLEYCNNNSDMAYQREVVHKADRFELLVLSWNPSSASGVHNHPAKGCCLKVLKGTLVEELYNHKLELIQETSCKESTISCIDDDKGLHSLKNESEADMAYSLHLYAPGGYQPEFFD